VSVPSLYQIDLLATDVGNSQTSHRVTDPKGKAHESNPDVVARYMTGVSFPAQLSITMLSSLFVLYNEEKRKKTPCLWEDVRAIMTKKFSIVTYSQL
jgi:hypothetical protein